MIIGFRSLRIPGTILDPWDRNYHRVNDMMRLVFLTRFTMEIECMDDQDILTSEDSEAEFHQLLSMRHNLELDIENIMAGEPTWTLLAWARTGWR